MSARLRLTLSYAAVVVVAGLAVFVVTLSVLRFVPEGNLVNADGATIGAPPSQDDLGAAATTPQDARPAPRRPAPGFAPDRSDLLEVLLPRTAIMLGLLGLAGLVGGWILAGRMLRPLQRIHAVATDVAAGSLERRVRLQGPRDEFRLLADTFDGMLDRIDGMLAEQRRFAANASHELRTPYAISRTLIDVAVADPQGRDVDELLRRLDETNRRGLDVVEALLALSTAEQGGAADPVTVEPVDLAELTAGVVAELRPLADEAGLTLETVFGEGDLDGDPRLVRQLVANLVLNAVRHNTGPGGRVEVRTGTVAGGRASIDVVNTGPVVAARLVPRLTEPFVRGAGRVAEPGGQRGSGLGLAIVARVAAVSGAELLIAPRPQGGLAVQVRFPAPGA